jgi:hypothetical protein
MIDCGASELVDRPAGEENRVSEAVRGDRLQRSIGLEETPFACRNHGGVEDAVARIGDREAQRVRHARIDSGGKSARR